MDQVKRERDRLSSQHDSLTQECNDARENAANREHQLQSDCDDRVTQCQTQASRTQTDLATCTRNLEATNAEKITCNNDVSWEGGRGGEGGRRGREGGRRGREGGGGGREGGRRETTVFLFCILKDAQGQIIILDVKNHSHHNTSYRMRVFR